jgi:uncharacterized protein (DUF2235 family)
VVFYDRGIGTANLWDRVTGGAFGHGVTRNIEDAYRFLMHNYEPGDEIYLFGFSRGAYTVRSTAGLLRNSGLLKKDHADRFREAMESYRSPSTPTDPESEAFRSRHSYEVTIKFMGVWDTVGALGIPITRLNRLTRRRHEFHDVKLSRSIENAFHALAIDERRMSFQPTLWVRQPHPTQRVEQVWFAGVHSNVGGGYQDSSLSDLALAWMLSRAEECDLALDDEYVRSTVHAAYDGRLFDSRRGVFRYLGQHLRPIGRNEEESVDPSAEQRLNDARLGYQPRNLLDYRLAHP